ncbi:MAG: TIGR01777 family oxidoreductase [Idiomarina sp.]
MKLLLTGGTGLIGTELVKRLRNQYQITVKTRSPTKAYRQLGHDIHAIKDLDEIKDIGDFAAVINLQGEGIADKRWTATQRERIEQSRWRVTRKLAEMIQAAEQSPEVFISGSAIGFYGDQGDTRVTETSNEPTDEFAHQLCAEWERLAKTAENGKTRVCLTRTGVVLSRHGGALQQMITPYKFGLGGPLGDGKQMMSWIHIDDMVGALEHMLSNADCQGVYNATAPQPVSNEEFSQSLARAMGKPHFMRVPAWVLKLALGDMSQMLLTGQAVLPQRLQEAGFRFRYPAIKDALKACV